jgi:hypothetical protein
MKGLSCACVLLLTAVPLRAATELPENPKLVPLEPAPQEPSKVPVRANRRKKIELGVRLGAAHHPSAGSEVTIAPGLSWGAHVRIPFQTWFGLVVHGGFDHHAVDIAPSAFGFEDFEGSQPAIRVLRLGADFDPNIAFTPQLHGFLGVGLAWNRLEAEALTASEPIPFVLSPRRGVLLEAGLTPRLAYRPWSWLGFSWWGNVAFPLLQSGDLFASGEGDLQTVRQDTGQLLSVGGFPHFSMAFRSYISVDVLF